MIFNAKEKLDGLSRRVDLMNRVGESEFFKRCEDCPYRICLQGIAADECSDDDIKYMNNKFELELDRSSLSCWSLARAYLSLLNNHQFDKLMKIQERDDMETYIAARIIKTFIETGCVILEGKVR